MTLNSLLFFSPIVKLNIIQKITAKLTTWSNFFMMVKYECEKIVKKVLVTFDKLFVILCPISQMNRFWLFITSVLHNICLKKWFYIKVNKTYEPDTEKFWSGIIISICSIIVLLLV